MRWQHVLTRDKPPVKQQVANLRDKSIFPDFADLPHENELDTDFFGTTDGSRYSPRKHWCFLAEIDSIENFLRLRLIVKPGGARVPIAFYTDDRGAGFASQAKRGYTVAVLYPEQHPFLDMTTGIRVEEEQTVKVSFMVSCRVVSEALV